MLIWIFLDAFFRKVDVATRSHPQPPAGGAVEGSRQVDREIELQRPQHQKRRNP